MLAESVIIYPIQDKGYINPSKTNILSLAHTFFRMSGLVGLG